MNLKYKPEEGFEIEKLTLIQKDGKYYYKYKTNDEIFEETINKSIYEELRKEKELFLSCKNYNIKKLCRVDDIACFSLIYSWLWFTIFVMYFLVKLVNLFFNFDNQTFNHLLSTFLPMLFFSFSQIFLGLSLTKVYTYKEKELWETYKNFQHDYQAIQFFNTNELEKMYSIRIYQTILEDREEKYGF